MPTEFDIVNVRLGALFEHRQQLVLGAPQRPLAAIGLDPDHDVDEVEAQFTPAGDHKLDRAPVNESSEQAAVGEAREDRLHPLPIELAEFLAAHLAVGKCELAVVRVAGHVADVGDIVRLVGQHELRQFVGGHWPGVDRRIAGVAMCESMVPEDPEVARMGDRRLEPLWRRGLAGSEVLVVVEEHEAIDLGGLKPSLDKVDTKHRQLLELEPQRIGIPGAGLAEPVQRDAERAQLRSVEMVDDDAGDFRNLCALATSHRPWPSTMVPSASIRIGRHRPNLPTLASSFALCVVSRRRTLRDAGRRRLRARVSKRSLGVRSLRLGRGACVSISLSAR